MFEPCNAMLEIPNEEMNNIVKIVKSLKWSGLLIRNVSETNQNVAKKQTRGFPSILLGIRKSFNR